MTRADGSATTTYGYDQLGRLTSWVTTFGGGTIRYGYGKASNLVSTTDSRGTTTNTFDASRISVLMTYPDDSGTGLLNFAVDDQGRRTDTWLDSNTANTSRKAHSKQEHDQSGRASRAIAETVNGAKDASGLHNSGSSDCRLPPLLAAVIAPPIARTRMTTAAVTNHGDEATTAAMRAATPITVAIPDEIRRNVVSRCDIPTSLNHAFPQRLWLSQQLQEAQHREPPRERTRPPS